MTTPPAALFPPRRGSYRDFSSPQREASRDARPSSASSPAHSSWFLGVRTGDCRTPPRTETVPDRRRPVLILLAGKGLFPRQPDPTMPLVSPASAAPSWPPNPPMPPNQSHGPRYELRRHHGPDQILRRRSRNLAPDMSTAARALHAPQVDRVCEPSSQGWGQFPAAKELPEKNKTSAELPLRAPG